MTALTDRLATLAENVLDLDVIIAAAGPPADRPGRILVVDDNEDNRDLLRRRLERQGHAVVTAENGRRALELLAGGGFDLVLLDIMMPELDGYQVLERVKADPATRDLPVLMVSALDEIRSIADLRSVALASGLVLSGRALKGRSSRGELIGAIVAAAKHYDSQRSAASA